MQKSSEVLQKGADMNKREIRKVTKHFRIFVR